MSDHFPDRQFISGDIASFIFFKSSEKYPAVCPVCGDKSPGAATFAPAWKSYTLLVDAAAQVRINQTTFHFINDSQQNPVIKFSFPHPSAKNARFQEIFHASI